MSRNKLRLQVALYARPKHPGTYHYALFITAKNFREPTTTKHHVKNTLQVDDTGVATTPWRYEKADIANVEAEPRLLVRVIIAKLLKSREQVEEILESVPVYQLDVKEFNCRTWVRDAVEGLRNRGAIAATLEWSEIERKSLDYVDRKRSQSRWDGSWGTAVPLMDLIEGNEVVQ